MTGGLLSVPIHFNRFEIKSVIIFNPNFISNKMTYLLQSFKELIEICVCVYFMKGKKKLTVIVKQGDDKLLGKAVSGSNDKGRLFCYTEKRKVSRSILSTLFTIT